jgi:hypothetical protein
LQIIDDIKKGQIKNDIEKVIKDIKKENKK